MDNVIEGKYLDKVLKFFNEVLKYLNEVLKYLHDLLKYLNKVFSFFNEVLKNLDEVLKYLYEVLKYLHKVSKYLDAAFCLAQNIGAQGRRQAWIKLLSEVASRTIKCRFILIDGSLGMLNA